MELYYIILVNKQNCGIFKDLELAQKYLKQYRQYLESKSYIEVTFYSTNLVQAYYGWEDHPIRAEIVSYPINVPQGILETICK